MTQRSHMEATPYPADATVRQTLAELLDRTPLSARDASALLHLPIKEVYAHLEHLRHSLLHSGGKLEVTPAACRACGFVFAKRERLTPPSRCPLCRCETISEPLFAIRSNKDGHVV